MAQAPEELKNRLENISAIQPLLAALRTISLSNWRFALKKIAQAEGYLDNIQSIHNLILELLPEESLTKGVISKKEHVIIIIGSNRGLCGDFNRSLVDQLIQINENPDLRPKIIIFGERLKKIIDRKKITFDGYFRFPNPSDLTPNFTKEFLKQTDSDLQLSEITLIFNKYRGAGKYATTFSPIFPNSFIKKATRQKTLEDYIFDTPSNEIVANLKSELSYLSLYYAMLLSAAAEHSTRFQLMENASTNAGHLSDELFLEVQAMRRQKITEEMQELAIGAGLLD